MDDRFFTNQYRVLSTLYKNTVSVGKNSYCPLDQGEIATELGLSRVIINGIFKELKENNYIIMLSRGKWQLTPQAIKFMKKLEA